MKIIFAGTPEFSATILNDLINTEHQIVAVYTQPDRRSGRGQKLLYSPVKQIAQEHQIAIEQPENFRSALDIETLAAYDAEVMIVVAYGIILPQAVLDTPRYGCLNIHASLLPRWRGAAPIQRAIEAGDKETGITIMQMDSGLDTGDMLYKLKCTIQTDDTGSSLHDKLAVLGSRAIIETLSLLRRNQLQGEAQNEEQACYAHKITKQEAKIDWNKSAAEIERKIRAFNSWPVAYTHSQNIKHLRIWKANVLEAGHFSVDSMSDPENGVVVAEDKTGIVVKCGSDFLNITELQLPGKKRISVGEFLNSKSVLGEQWLS